MDVIDASRLQDNGRYPGLAREAAKAGFVVVEETSPTGTRKWTVNKAAEFHAFALAYDPIPPEKQERIRSIKVEALRRARLIFPAIESIDALELELHRWLSIAAAARSPTALYSSMLAIAQAARTAVNSVSSASTLAEVAAVSVSWP